ncbi:hypothetical protein GCM10020358_68200 [Amorphoplanes nipponensis]|uniref:Uncharacterized protein n=1 Tax=Actinoplanes nipponensis TaxID=135950 RepID=A0A919JLR8_9ACTN|nr:hypothetical protein Ani05nite_50890 [Actinoplanes nipponensis]
MRGLPCRQGLPTPCLPPWSPDGFRDIEVCVGDGEQRRGDRQDEHDGQIRPGFDDSGFRVLTGVCGVQHQTLFSPAK